MRQKKLILLYCPDVELLSAMSLALRLHPYVVVDVHEIEDALRASLRKETVCGIIVHARPGDLAGRLVHRLLEAASHLPLLLVDRAGDLAPIRYADIVLYGRNTSMAHILASLKVLCLRKPGQRLRSGA
jgi:hypothetical protein